MFNVCIEVGDVDGVTARVKDSNVDHVLREPKKLVSGEESLPVLCSVVRSCVGNVIHSIISLDGHRGEFLPGFQKVRDSDDSSEGPLTNVIDHVTYICRTGETRQILEWYSKCFGMERFLTNNQETVEDNGIEIGGEVGMRMTVGEWITSWLCREEGVELNKDLGPDS